LPLELRTKSEPPRRPASPGTAGLPRRDAPGPRDGPRSSRNLVIGGVAVGLLVAGVIVAGAVRAFRSGGDAPRLEPEAAPAAPEPQSAGPASPPAAGITETEVVLGMSAPFSGAVKELGRGMRAGIEAAFGAANEAGGVAGRKVRLVALDDGYEPSRTRQVMQELLENRKVFAIVGSVGTPTAAVSIPYVQQRKVVFFGGLSGGPLLRKVPPDRYVFNYRPSYAEETAAAVHYLVEVRRIPPQQISVFCQDDEFGQAGLAGVEQQLRKYRRDPSRMLKVTYKRNSSDVSEAVDRVRKLQSKLRAVVMVATYQAAVQFIEKVKGLNGPPLVFTNVSAVDSNALAEGLVQGGRGNTSDVVVTQVVPLPTSKATAIIRYRQALERHALGEQPGFVSLEGYVVGSILVEGLKRAGKDVTSESLVAALEGIRELDLGIGAAITFGQAEHQGSHKVWGTVLEPGGKYKAIELE
jgi:branched-chain amino acid transport system substrate-binding protein